MPPQLILASSSPKRKEILTSLGLRFKVHSPAVEEITSAVSSTALVKTNAVLKARAAAEAHPRDFIIGADTIVINGKNMFFKPRNLKEGFAMLESYRSSPSSNYVVTGLALFDPRKKKFLSRIQKSRFQLTPMSQERQKKIYRLIFSPHHSGGFSIEGLGSLLLDQISGSYFNILGLPVYLLDKMFLDLGSDLLQFKK